MNPFNLLAGHLGVSALLSPIALTEVAKVMPAWLLLAFPMMAAVVAVVLVVWCKVALGHSIDTTETAPRRRFPILNHSLTQNVPVLPSTYYNLRSIIYNSLSLVVAVLVPISVDGISSFTNTLFPNRKSMYQKFPGSR